MKHPIKILVALFLLAASAAAALLLVIRYMDVLQKQFEVLRELLFKRQGRLRDNPDTPTDVFDADEDDEPALDKSGAF
ncbi:MAG: hypothetical protein LBH86_03765 [Oscillospiraceae bacterium]|jgi:hypothetical protein|nr:hypothetical protein [Oscillospiraceae bacterium]